MDVPQVDVFMGDLHGALPIDVQVWGGHQVHVETFWKYSQRWNKNGTNMEKRDDIHLELLAAAMQIIWFTF